MYRYMNMNPKGNDVDDCTVRAISVAEGISWDEAYDKLSNSARRLGLMMSSVPAIDYYLDKRYIRIDTDVDTVGEFIKEHPRGTYLITMPGHITVLKNGVNYDTFNCGNRKLWCAWRIK